MSASRPGSTRDGAPSLEAIGLALTLSAIFALSSFPVLNTDYWWHLLAGRMVVEHGSIPARDSLSFTAAGSPWLDHEWLAELIFYCVHARMGVRGVVLLIAAVITLTFYLVYLRTRRLGAPAISQALLILGFLATIGSVFLRIQPFTLLMLSAYLLILDQFRRSHRARPLLLLPLLMLPWTNLHGGFAVGPAVIAIAISAAQIERWRGGAVSRRDLATLWAVLGATVIAAAANPNGLAHLLYPFRFLTPNFFTRHINESQRPGLDDPVAILFFVMLAALLVLALVRRRTLSWFDGLLSAAFTFLALSQLRHISLWAIAVTPVLASLMRRDGARQPQPAISNGARWAMWIAGPLAAVIAAVVLTSDAEIRSLEQRRYPARAAEFLRAHSPGGNVFTEYRWGGYVLWRLYPPFRVFIDGRADTVYPEEVLRRYLAIHSVAAGWNEELSRSGADVALVVPETPLARALDGEAVWKRIYADEVSVVFVKR